MHKDLNFVFKSPDHLRYEFGKHVSGPHGGAGRAIKVEPNSNGCEGYNIRIGDGYIITIFNLDGNHPVWQNNIQVTPKPMRIVSQTSEKIVLRGYQVQAKGPFGWVDFNGADYGLSILLNNGEIDKCILHMHDRSADIEYLKGEVLFSVNEPEIISWARKANEQFLSQQVTDGRQLLINIYRSVKANPGQLREVKDFASLGSSFFFMLNQKISDDTDTLQMMASVGYLCLSKAIKQDKSNPNLYKDRLYILLVGHEPLSYTVMHALKIDVNSYTFMGSMATISARDAIYKMEIADLELYPVIYRQIPIFKKRKEEFDEKISRQFFMPEKTLDNVVKSGLENHEKLLVYLENKVINQEDVDF